MRRVLIAASLMGLFGVCLAVPREARAIFGEEDWLSGQNELLVELLAKHAEEVAQLGTLVENARHMLGTVNDMAALARRARATYEMLAHYRLEDLARDARVGLVRAFPELGELADETTLAIANGQALEAGSGAFFSRIDRHDVRVSDAMRRVFEHGYQASVWPLVFPDAMKFHATPSPTELLVQERYRRTGDAQRRAVQQTAMGVLAATVRAYVQDAESKDNVQLKAQATTAALALQTMEDTTEMRNLAEQDAATSEAQQEADAAFRARVGATLKAHARTLVDLGGRP